MIIACFCLLWVMCLPVSICVDYISRQIKIEMKIVFPKEELSTDRINKIESFENKRIAVSGVIVGLVIAPAVLLHRIYDFLKYQI